MMILSPSIFFPVYFGNKTYFNFWKKKINLKIITFSSKTKFKTFGNNKK